MSGPRGSAWARFYYRVLLLAYPKAFRRGTGRELAEIFALACAASRSRHGLAGVAARVLRSTIDVPVHGIRERFAAEPAPAVAGPRVTCSEWVSGLVADLRYARSSLMSRPGLTVAVVITLALGIGANTAIFSVVDATLLAGSRWRDPERLVSLQLMIVEEGVTFWPSAEELYRWTAELDVFERVEASSGNLASLAHPDGARRVSNTSVSPGYLDAIAARPVLGRFFTTGDTEAAAEPVAILPESMWRRLYGSDPEILGSTLELGGAAYVVVGVASRVRREKETIYTALPTSGPEATRLNVTGHAWLRPGVTVEQARAQYEAVASGEHERLGRYQGDLVVPRNVFWNIEDFRTALLALFAAVFLVLTIACVNVANLLLTNAGRRRGEFAVRAAVGASGGRLARLVLVESLVLAALGGAAALAIAQGAIALMRLVRPDGPLGSGIDAVQVDARVLLYAGLVSVVTGLTFGAVPALRRAVRDPARALQTAAMGRGTSSSRLRSGLVAAETALALVLLVAAALTFQSFLGLRFSDPGFDADRLLSMGVQLPPASYPEPEARRAFFDTLTTELEEVAGVERVMLGSGAIPPSSVYTGGDMIFEDSEGETRPEIFVSVSGVGDGFGDFMGVTLLAGRDFLPADMETADAAAERSVVVNAAMARKFWPEGEALGARFRFSLEPDVTWNRIVGIAADVAQRGFEAEADAPHMYVPARFDGRYMEVVMRLAPGAAPPVREVREVFTRLDPQIPTDGLETSADLLVEALSGPRFRAALFVAFGVVAIALAIVGIFGVVSYSMSQRRREIAIRLALGAAPRRVMRLVVRQGMTPVLVGLVLGVGVSLALARLIAGLLHGVEPADPMVLGAVVATFALVAAFATWLPARRAVALSVVAALRAE